MRPGMIALALALVFAASLAAQSGVAFELDPELVRYLELTPSQVAAILNNDREFNSTAGLRREQRLALDAALAAEEAKPSPSPARLGEIEAEIERTRRDGLARRNDALNRNRSILTPAQRERLQPKFADPSLDSEMWQAAFDSGLVPWTRDTVQPYRRPYWRRPVSVAIQIYLGLSERQVGALNAIDEELRTLLARIMEPIIQTQEDILQAKLQTVIDAKALGEARSRLLQAYRDLETAEQVSHARRLSVLTPDQVKKVSAFPVRWPGSQRVFAAAVCEGLMASAEPRFLTGYLVAVIYSTAAGAEPIECYRPVSLELALPGIASGLPGAFGPLY